jgi:hypothetical protein
MMMEENNYKNKVEELLINNPTGLTIQEISDKLNTSRITISIALAELRGEDRIDIREIGNAKLHFLKEKCSNGI